MPEQSLRPFLRQFGVIRVHNEREASDYFRQAMDAYLEPFNASLSGMYRDAQAQVDSPQEYDRIDNSCGQEMRDFRIQMSR
jgi:hypothetical protein